MANYLRYTNQKAGRNQPLDPKLVEALNFLEPMGITAEVFSGGVGENAGALSRSGRHVHGGAGDMRFFKGDQRLDWANPADRPIFEQIVKTGKERGITGFGAGPGYMGPGTMHVGYGKAGVWGAGGLGRNAPEWLSAAYNGTAAPAGPAYSPPPPSYAGNPLTGGTNLAGGPPAASLPASVQQVATLQASAPTPTPTPMPAPTLAPAAPEVSLEDKIGNALWGDKAGEFNNSFGPDAKPNSLSKGLGLFAGAMSGNKGNSDASQITPSSIGNTDGADAQRVAAATQLMSSMMLNKKKMFGTPLAGRMV